MVRWSGLGKNLGEAGGKLRRELAIATLWSWCSRFSIPSVSVLQEISYPNFRRFEFEWR